MRRSQGGGPVASRTQIVCLCEGRKGESIDEVFINRLMKSLQPDWLRPGQGATSFVWFPVEVAKRWSRRCPRNSGIASPRAAIPR